METSMAELVLARFQPPRPPVRKTDVVFGFLALKPSRSTSPFLVTSKLTKCLFCLEPLFQVLFPDTPGIVLRNRDLRWTHRKTFFHPVQSELQTKTFQKLTLFLLCIFQDVELIYYCRVYKAVKYADEYFIWESNQEGLEAAVEAAATFLNKAVKPVIVGGPKLRVAKAQKAFLEFAEASGYPIAVMPSGTGLVPENHPHFIGTYWGAVSTSYCGEIVESADAYVFVGPIFNDYSSVGYSLLIKKEKSIIVQPNRVTIGNGPSLGWVFTADFLTALSKKVRTNTTAVENYRRIYVPPGIPLKREKDEPLRVNVLFKHIQELLSGDTAIIAETGDSWFNCQKLRLPENCGYEFQMQYGSIGWSVGATLGYAQAATDKRVIACIGDGSFQVTAQDISTMIRCGQRSIIFLINNGGYTIEVEIHDGPYNVIKNWDYTGFVDAIHNGEGKCWTAKVRTEDDLIEAIAAATGPQKDSVCFIEVFVHRDDTSKELLEWGSRVAAANSRPPNPQ